MTYLSSATIQSERPQQDALLATPLQQVSQAALQAANRVIRLNQSLIYIDWAVRFHTNKYIQIIDLLSKILHAQ